VKHVVRELIVAVAKLGVVAIVNFSEVLATTSSPATTTLEPPHPSKVCS
jgi:hypothetical protein